MPKSNLSAETFVPVLKSELSRQFNEQFGNTNQYDIKNINFQNNTAEVVAKDFATDYEPGSTTKIKWNIDELIPLPASITLPTQYSSQIRDLYDTHQYSEQDVFKILAKENKTLNFSELTIEDFNANAGVITLKAKPTSTVYKTGTTFPVYVNLSQAVRIEYNATNLVRPSSGYNTHNVTKFEYHGETIHNGVNGAAIPTLAAGTTLKYEIVGKTLTDANTFQNVEGTQTIQFNPKTGQIRYYAQPVDFSGGIYTIKATYTTINETFNDLQGEVQYTSYWTFYAPAYTAPKNPPVIFADVYYRSYANTATFMLSKTAVNKIPVGYYIHFTYTYRAKYEAAHETKDTVHWDKSWNSTYWSSTTVVNFDPKTIRGTTSYESNMVCLNVVLQKNGNALTTNKSNSLIDGTAGKFVPLFNLTGNSLFADSGTNKREQIATATASEVYYA